MNPFSIPPALAAFLNVILFLWVYGAAPRGLPRQTFLLWTLWLGFWNAWLAIGYNLENAQMAYSWYKYFGAGIVRLLAPLFLHFVMAITDSCGTRTNQWALRIAYVSGILFALLDGFTPFLMAGVTHYYWGFYPKAAKGDVFFGLSFLAIVVYAFVLLWKAARTSTGERRNQIRYVLYGAAVCFSSGFTNFLPLYGYSIYPTGNLMNSVYSLVVAYAIVEHGLMDIQLVLRKGTVYGLLAGGLTMVYLTLVTVLEKVFGHYGLQENIAFYTAAFPVTVVLAPAMKTRLEPFVDYALFGKSPTHPASSFKSHDMALMGVLATEMAHELAKPLTHIMNEGSRLESSVKGSSKRSVSIIEKETQRVAEILDGFALLSPDRPLHQISVSLGDLLDEALETLGVEEDRSIRVVRHFGKFPSIFVNPGQVVQVLTNVIQNAWQAMNEGGVLTLSIHSARLGEQPAMKISVEDTGPGVPAKIKERVFEPFFSTKRAQGGRGVGLTISQAMVERHGGSIFLESPIHFESGTRVTIILPIERKEPLHAF